MNRLFRQDRTIAAIMLVAALVVVRAWFTDRP